MDLNKIVLCPLNYYDANVFHLYWASPGSRASTWSQFSKERRWRVAYLM